MRNRGGDLLEGCSGHSFQCSVVYEIFKASLITVCSFVFLKLSLLLPVPMDFFVLLSSFLGMFSKSKLKNRVVFKNLFLFLKFGYE